ncbi:MAG: preprotein translocase subunit SecE [Ruminococcus sp.]|jgi:preprotein translocase subunit SecE|nr:preprotein translocase subunit SecE [Ruminococcus sp.]
MADKKPKSAFSKAVETAKKQADDIAADKVKAKKSGKPAGKKQNRVVKYLKDLRSELKKVVWPSREKVVHNTTVVMVCMVAYGLIIWGIDSGLAALFALMVTNNPAA